MRKTLSAFAFACMTALLVSVTHAIPQDPATTLSEILFGIVPYRHLVCDKGETSVLFFTKTEVKNSEKRDYIITRIVSSKGNYFYTISSSDYAFIPRYFVVENKTTKVGVWNPETFRTRLQIEAPQYARYGTIYGQSDCRITPIPGEE